MATTKEKRLGQRRNSLEATPGTADLTELPFSSCEEGGKRLRVVRLPHDAVETAVKVYTKAEAVVSASFEGMEKGAGVVDRPLVLNSKLTLWVTSVS
jgi:hypothetical protein